MGARRKPRPFSFKFRGAAFFSAHGSGKSAADAGGSTKRAGQYCASRELDGMGLLGRYVFRTTMMAFIITAVTLTILVWFTQVIREFDIVTNQRQSVLTFLSITSLFIPMLLMMIAPIAFVISASHVLNKLSSDSEIIVMNAAGLSPWRALRPLLAAALVVSVLVAFLAIYLSPLALRDLRNRVTEVRTDILTHIAQPGRFTSIGGGLTFHIAGRQPDGILLGIFIDDRRDPKEHTTILAQSGEVVKNETGAFLLLDGGSVQTVEAGQTDPRIVTFQRYAFDLSNFGGDARTIVYSAHEKFFWDLFNPADPSNDRATIELRNARPTGLPIISHSLCGIWPTCSWARRRPRGKAARWRCRDDRSHYRRSSLGFLSVIVGVHMPACVGPAIHRAGGAMAVGLWRVSRGTAVEPAPSMAKLATLMTKWLPATAP